MLAIGGIVDEERLERREEHAGCVADARDRLLGGTDRAPQFLQHEIVAGNLLAPQQTALKLCDKHRPCLRLEGPEIVA